MVVLKGTRMERLDTPCITLKVNIKAELDVSASLAHSDTVCGSFLVVANVSGKFIRSSAHAVSNRMDLRQKTVHRIPIVFGCATQFKFTVLPGHTTSFSATLPQYPEVIRCLHWSQASRVDPPPFPLPLTLNLRTISPIPLAHGSQT
jgi:hypothetical protein